MRKIDLAGEWLIRDTNDEYTIDIKLPSTTELSKIAFEGINYECEKEHLRRLYYVNRNIFIKNRYILMNILQTGHLRLILREVNILRYI